MLEAQIEDSKELLRETAANSESKQIANQIFKGMKQSFEEVRRLMQVFDERRSFKQEIAELQQ